MLSVRKIWFTKRHSELSPRQPFRKSDSLGMGSSGLWTPRFDTGAQLSNPRLWVSGEELPSSALQQLVSDIKSTFPSYGQSMGKVRKALEHWVEFINPYHRIRSSVECLMSELQSLDVPNQTNQLLDITECESPEEWSQEWRHQAEIISKATGLCFSGCGQCFQ